MAVYAIGDVQGCFSALLALLDRLHFDGTAGIGGDQHQPQGDLQIELLLDPSLGLGECGQQFQSYYRLVQRPATLAWVLRTAIGPASVAGLLSTWTSL